ncbi:exopolysaccharide biosynthesis protein [Paenirhodobacter sp.]|uniref:exopolysaccharide biosynthesis protein n=1 Tax=Paenirhodobacter sp. TaxID=1965326 RepID=UPI003B425922
MPEHDDALSRLLDQLEEAGHEPDLCVAGLADVIGRRAFAALMFVAALVAVSPASVVPGVTSVVAVVSFLLAGQMVLGQRSLWLPGVIAARRIEGARLRAAVQWLRRPVGWLERLSRPRLLFLLRGPALLLWLALVMGLCLVMPFLEVIPGAGTLAATCIALIAAAILTQDGVLAVLGAGFAAAYLFLVVRMSSLVVSVF